MTASPNRRRFLAAATALALPWTAAAATRAPLLPLAENLQADGRLSRTRGAPIVVLFSLPGCPYCEIVRRSHLGPMLADPRHASRVIIRQIDIDADQALVGFDGKRTTHARIARDHGVRAAPVVAFWDGEGRDAAPPLRGMLLPDFYGGYLEDAIEAARKSLSTPR